MSQYLLGYESLGIGLCCYNVIFIAGDGKVGTPKPSGSGAGADASKRTSSVGSSGTPARNKRVGWADDISEEREESSQENNPFKTPQRKADQRAISTPFGKGVTFLMYTMAISTSEKPSTYPCI